jgi:pimeloyl-ACP methyl ester carboxylesterase
MEFRKFRSLCFLSAMLVGGINSFAQSEPSAAQQSQVPVSAVQVPEQPQQQLPTIQAVPLQPEANVALQQATSISNVPASLGRPILFVHGCGGNDSGWYLALNSIKASLLATRPDLYSVGRAYGALFDGTHVFFYDFYSSQFVDPSQISPNARFFTILFFDQRQSTLSAAIDKTNVWNVAIPVHANELAQVVATIQDITYVKDLIVIGHSMGGLVARTYVEGLAGPITSIPGTTCSYGPCYSYAPGSTAFQDNVGSVITLNTPHNGAPYLKLESLAQSLGYTADLPCQGINRREMVPTDSINIIGALNYVSGAAIGAATAKPIASSISVNSIKSYNNHDWNNDPNSDGILYADTMDVRLSLQSNVQLASNIVSTDNSFGDTYWPDSACYATIPLLGTEYILHTLECVGAQQQSISKMVNGISSSMLGVPLAVYTLSSASSILGGNSFTGTVTLTTGAPPHGATVLLSSDDASVQVPANLIVPAGAVSANFNLTSSAVVAAKTVKITANYGRAAQNASVTLQPAIAQVALTATSLDFSTQLIRSMSIGHVLSVTNSGTAPLIISSVVANGDFAQTNTCTGTIVIQASCAINVVFKPSAFGLASGTLTIIDNAPGSPHNIALSGTGIDIFLSIVRPSRPHRSATASSNVKEATFELNVAGGNVSEQVQVKCAPLMSGQVCSLAKIDSNKWNVSLTSENRASRLRQGPSQSVTINATVGNAVRSILVPLSR